MMTGLQEPKTITVNHNIIETSRQILTVYESILNHATPYSGKGQTDNRLMYLMF